MRRKEEMGITLIALVVTIVVLLILAGVSIAMLTGENGIIKQAQKAKEETIIGREKEAIALAYSSCKGLNMLNTVTAEQLQDELSKNEKNTIVTGSGKKLNILFFYTQNKYSINQDGKIEQKKDENIDFEGVEVYAKIYSYDDGSGSVLVLSSDENYMDMETGITLVQDYGNIGTKSYYYIYEENFVNDNEKNIYIYTEEGSILPPWLTLSTEEEDYGGIKFLSKYYKDNNNIVKVKIANEILPMSTACWFVQLESLKTIENLENVNTSQVIDMNCMFRKL